MKKSMCIVVIVLICAVSIAGRMFFMSSGEVSEVFQYVKEVAKKAEDTIKEVNETPEFVCHDMNEMADCINQCLLALRDTVVIQLSGVPEGEMQNINKYTNSCWGSCEQYTLLQSPNPTDKIIKIRLEPDEEAYVYNAICKNGDITQASLRAQQLYEATQKVRNKKIKANMTPYQKELAFYNYLIKHCKYDHKHAGNCKCNDTTRDVSIEESSCHTAYGALVEGKPVCSGYARAMTLLLACEGINSKLVFGQSQGEYHNWNLIELDDKWYHLDVTWDDVEKKTCYYSYLNITDKMMAKTHAWTITMYPEANGKKYNYYRYNKNYFNKKKSFKNRLKKELIQKNKKSYCAMIDGFRLVRSDFEYLFDESRNIRSIHWNTLDHGGYSVITVKVK